MKVISIWQPFASLIVEGCKVFETRGWPAPASVIGTRIGIASTKNIMPAQRSHCEDEAFKEFYERTGLDEWIELPRGYLLGTVVIDSVELMTEELMEEVSAEEQSYGWWDLGNYAWRLTNPIKLAEPIPIRGKQGLFEWNGDLPSVHTGKVQPDEETGEASNPGRSERPQDIRRHLRAV
ncbi:ASCH domain-containing protein [Phaeobacter gallaeciensis]|uniref:ASCH domain-containing protein n=1 Tax=Phaeobacter gallaeciensis TaxID=60890 RepID=UPI00238021AA|nr:ASCH domain-containing protein [Phaeobacter gallaeciensis]